MATQQSLNARPQLLLFPFNGNSIEALDCANDSFDVMGFIDDSPEKIGQTYQGFRVLDRGALRDFPDARVLAVPGSPVSYLQRSEVVASLGISALRFAQVIHRRASIAPAATVGRNVLIMAGVVVTSNATIGDHVCVLPNSVIHHDVTVGGWTLLGSNVSLAGGATVGENCYVASGCSVRDGITIGDRALVGMGSTVTRNVEPGARVAGSPARPIGRHG